MQKPRRGKIRVTRPRKGEVLLPRNISAIQYFQISPPIFLRLHNDLVALLPWLANEIPAVAPFLPAGPLPTEDADASALVREIVTPRRQQISDWGLIDIAEAATALEEAGAEFRGNILPLTSMRLWRFCQSVRALAEDLELPPNPNHIDAESVRVSYDVPFEPGQRARQTSAERWARYRYNFLERLVEVKVGPIPKSKKAQSNWLDRVFARIIEAHYAAFVWFADIAQVHCLWPHRCEHDMDGGCPRVFLPHHGHQRFCPEHNDAAAVMRRHDATPIDKEAYKLLRREHSGWPPWGSLQKPRQTKRGLLPFLPLRPDGTASAKAVRRAIRRFDDYRLRPQI